MIYYKTEEEVELIRQSCLVVCQALAHVAGRIRPGMTGLAQLYGGVGAAWTRGIDRLYRSRRGLALDLRIVCWSVAINLFGKARVRRALRSGRAP